jgi:hypothetical protein
LSRHLYAEYKIDSKLFRQLVAAQGGKCPICQQTPKPTKLLVSGFVVDHCHETGKVRSLLCSRCNGGLGMFKDNPQLLVRAIAYLASGGRIVGRSGAKPYGGCIFLRGSRWWWSGKINGRLKRFSFASKEKFPTKEEAAIYFNPEKAQLSHKLYYRRTKQST